MKRQILSLALYLLFGFSLAFGQTGGNLQIHFVDVGQGDGAVLISPAGEVALFDVGGVNCARTVGYLQQIGVTRIDYMFTSHYHADHIGCTRQIVQQFGAPGEAIDRGESYASAAFDRYVAAVGSRRRTGYPGMTRVLGSPPDWVVIEVLALNGDGLSTTDENSLSMVTLVRYGTFRAEIGGDLTGVRNRGTVDVESRVAPRVGQLDLYKVHHHCSRYSSNDNWLSITSPTVAIVSLGDTNPYGHAHADCVNRLHAAGVTSYWTETGSGAAPDPAYDTVWGTIIVEVSLTGGADDTFTVSAEGAAPVTYTVVPK